VAAPERHVLFAYTPKHDGAAVDELLRGYKGTLVADAHAVFDHLYRSGDVIEAGCWAHYPEHFVIPSGAVGGRCRAGRTVQSRPTCSG
jgi:transposase